MNNSQVDDKNSHTETDAVQAARVLFADLLGLSDDVDVAESLEDGEKLAARLKRFAEQFSGKEVEDADIQAFYAKRYWAFSDSIVIRWFDGSEAQTAMTDFDADLEQLSSIALAQAVIMHDDRQLVRGGIGQGWLLEREDVIVGAALVNAARIEKAIKMPFIGVERELYDYYRKHPVRRTYARDIEPLASLFIDPCEYTCGLPALDYFMTMLGEIDLSARQKLKLREIPPGEARSQFANECWRENRASYVRWHRDFVAQGLQHTKANVREKYSALMRHHNSRTRSLFPNLPDMLVQGED